MAIAFAVIFIVGAIILMGSWIHEMYKVVFKD